eukprot:Colp12_sorted_trinity150504_noHs@11421
MVKFGNQLESQAVTEWAEYYLDYKGLRKILKKIKLGKSKEKLTSQQSQRSLPAIVNIPPLHNNHSDSESSLLSRSHAGTDNSEIRFNEPSESSPLLVNGSSGYGTADELSQVSVNSGGEVREESRSNVTVGGMDYERQFQNKLQKELQKINDFYMEKEMCYADLLRNLVMKANMTPKAQKKTLSHLKKSFIDLYRRQNWLRNYSILNYTAFSKILKKHDKMSMNRPLKDEVMAEIANAPFYCTGALLSLIDETESEFARLFEGRDLTQARTTLLMKQKEHTDWDLIRLGFKTGLLVPLIAWIITVALKPYKDADPADDVQYMRPVYISVGMLIFMVWLWGVNIWVWTRARVNYVYILELDPRTRVTFVQVFSEATRLSIVYLLCLLLFVLHVGGVVQLWGSPKVYPLALLVYIVFKFVLPFRRIFTHWNTRRFLLK